MASSINLELSSIFEYVYLTAYIRYCAEDKYLKFWELKDRKIGNHEFLLITKGTGQFNINNRTYNVKENDLVLFKPNIRHNGKSVTLPFEFLCIHFDIYVSNIKSTLNISSKSTLAHHYETAPENPVNFLKVKLNFPEHISIHNSQSMQLLLKKIIAEKQKRQTGSDILTKSYFVEFLIALLREQSQSFETNKYPDEIIRVINYIKSNYMHRIRLWELSNQVHLEPTYLSKLFLKHTGYNITKFIIKHRLLVAKEQLLETDNKIEEIAISTGFCDLHHFSKVFRAYEGISPSQYRNMKKL
jgi:YesN/AraC family two-component response regulator